MIVSREFGLIIIEVKSCGINDIEAIEANLWKMKQRFYSDYFYPYRQAEKQLYALLDRYNEKVVSEQKLTLRSVAIKPTKNQKLKLLNFLY